MISTSKIKKINAIRKNRKEKGIRDFLFRSNPHSKADGFSRSWAAFLAKKEFKVIKIIGNKIEIIIIWKIMLILMDL